MTVVSPCAPGGLRVVGLDGLRGLAALYVLVHHCWLLTFPGYPASTGPGWLGWLTHGRLAVVAFIVLSGFSLAISPARDGWRLGGALRFARRRARRILPPYWAALAVSLMIASAVPSLPLSAPPTVRSIAVYGLLMQDFLAAPAPNGAFWSIAVEAGLYLLFPFLVLLRRRAGAAATLAAITVPVLLIGLLHPGVSTTDKTTGYALELAPLFTLGVLAAGIVTARDRIRRLPWCRLAALAAAPVLLLMAVRGSVWTVRHYYWVDLAAGPAIAMLLAAVATRRPAGLIRLLASGPLRALGGWSFSLYLIHLPIVALISRRVVAPHAGPGLPAFWVTLALAVPICLVAARVFAAAFETPSTGAPAGWASCSPWAPDRGVLAAGAVGRRRWAGPRPPARTVSMSWLLCPRVGRRKRVWWAGRATKGITMGSPSSASTVRPGEPEEAAR